VSIGLSVASLDAGGLFDEHVAVSSNPVSRVETNVAGILLLFHSIGGSVLQLFGAEHSGAGFWLLQYLALAGGFVAVNSVHMTQLRVEKRIALIFVPSAVLSGIHFGISYRLLPAGFWR
jgi:hypothetical protein